MDEDQKVLAERVRKARKTMHYSQKRLAEAAGVSLGVISNFERGVTFPQPSNLRHILQVVGLDDEVSDADVVRLGGDNQLIDKCPQCDRLIWPATYELVFDVLGAFMDTMGRAERKAFQRWVTAPVHNGRPWMRD